MTAPFRRRLEIASNIAILAMAALMCLVLIRDYVTPTPRRSRPSAPRDPSTLHIKGLDLSRADRTLIFAISSVCPYCKASEPFYRRLKSAEYSRLQFAALMPQPEAEARNYVQQAQLGFSQIVSADLGQLGISGTPTLILVDRTGKVLRLWHGLLPPEAENGVLEALQTGP